MRVLSGNAETEAKRWMEEALRIADGSCCLSSQSGAVVVNNGLLIGKGFNSPPGNEKIEKCLKDELSGNFRSDRTCCVHAEERAVMDAIELKRTFLKGATLYYIRKKNGEKVFAGKPYCTICSKLALDVGIAHFVLWHENGITEYSMEEFNRLSFEFHSGT